MLPSQENMTLSRYFPLIEQELQLDCNSHGMAVGVYLEDSAHASVTSRYFPWVEQELGLDCQ
jgi:hypothetical protein